MQDKESLRILGKSIRENINTNDNITVSKAIFEHITKQDYFINAKKIFVYINFGKEIITRDFILKCISLNKIVAVPVITKEKEMIFYRITSLENLKQTNFGLCQPDLKNYKFDVEQSDEETLIIVPALVFDKNRYRVGYGGGYYDKFLSNNVYKKSVGICLNTQIVDSINVNEFDVQVDAIVTEIM